MRPQSGKTLVVGVSGIVIGWLVGWLDEVLPTFLRSFGLGRFDTVGRGF